MLQRQYFAVLLYLQYNPLYRFDQMNRPGLTVEIFYKILAILMTYIQSNALTRIVTAILYILMNIVLISQVQGQIEIQFSQERGFYSAPINVELSSSGQLTDTIRYTTDHSKPTSTHGTIYTGPINISGTTSVRALAYSGPSESRAITHSYMFLSDIVSQGYMNTNSSTTDDQEITDALLALPAISIVSDDISRDDIEEETEISVEMIFPNGREGFMLHCGIEIWGGSPTNPKKSYRLEFKGKYGDSKLEYNVFEADDYESHEYNILPTNEFDKLLLRAGSQDGLNAEFGNENHAQFIRNRFMMDVGIELGYPQAHGRYVHAYVNGEYAGQYHLMERPDNSWFESYYGFDKDDFEARRGVGDYWDYSDGDPENSEGIAHTAMTTNINLTSEANWNNTSDFIDLESAANYLVMMSFLSGFDWRDSHNSLSGGHVTPGVVPYQFLLWDLDFSIGQGGKWHPNRAGDVNYFNAPFEQDGPVPNELVGHPEFDLLMADHLHCACFDDGPLNESNAISLYSKRAAQIEESITAEAARWGNQVFTENDNIDVPNWSKSMWEVERDYILNTFLPQRRLNLINHFKTNGAYPDIEAVSYSHNGGQHSSGYQLTLSNPNSTGIIYYTIDGDDPRDYGDLVNPSAQIYTGPVTLAPGVYEIKARIKDGNEWSAMCPKKFYIGQEYANLQINEIHYNPNSETIASELIEGKDLQFMEIKNTGSTDVLLNDLIIDKGITVHFSDGLTIPANGFIVLAEDSAKFELKYGFVPDVIWEGKLDGGGERLRLLGPDRVAVDELTYDDDTPWDETPDAGTYSLALRRGNWDNSLYESWTIQDTFFTPRADNLFDTDGDGVLDGADQCPGFDDAIDTNSNDIPDDCECPENVLEDTRTNIIVNRNAQYTIETNGYIPTGMNVAYEAGITITLLPNFEIKNGALFLAQIKDCD